MHGSSLRRMEWFVDNYLKDDRKYRILDVGSYDVAGGTYKQFFEAERFDYVGLDMVAGPNVDLVPARPYCWREVADASFDIVISGQAFEHMEFFWITAGEMARALKPDGLLCIIAPRGFARHRYPVDCYRFDADGMAALAKWCNLDILHASTDMQPENAPQGWHIENCEDSILIARKPVEWSGLIDWQNYQFSPCSQLPESGFVPCPPVTSHPALLLSRQEEELERYKEEIASKESDMRRLRELVEGYEKSRSWRITRPLRALSKLCRKMLG